MKSPTHLERCIVCPKCGTKTMRKALGKNPVAEYFDDRCHQYFTVTELVHAWGYDVSDFMPGVSGGRFPISVYGEIEVRDGFVKTHGRHPWMSLPDFTPAEKFPDTVSDLFEGEWRSKLDRDLAYEEVTAMQLGIPSWAMEDYSVDTGATHH